MLMAMKGYALGMMERRLSLSKYNVALDTESEGSIITAIKLLMDTAIDWKFKGIGQSLWLWLFPWINGKGA